MIRTAFTVLALIALAALDWAALSDILAGEEDVVVEWSVLVVSLVVIAGMVVYELRDGTSRRS